MSISDLYSSGEHKRNIGHFADIVKLALLDGTIEKKEQNLLDRLAKILGISSSEYKSILKTPEKYPTTFASSFQERTECLYYLTRMMLIDGRVSDEGVRILKRITVGLGFSADSTDRTVEKAIKMFLRIPDLDDFTDEMRKVNK